MDQKKIRLLKGLSTGLVVMAMVLAFLIAGIRIFGVQVYGVLTGSMEPAYPTGSLIYVRKTSPQDLRVNDVITFSLSPGVIATHRIVEVVPDESNPSVVYFRTKGDANRDVDAALVSANNVVGKAMFAVPQLGFFASYIQQPPGIYVAIVVCGLMIAFVFYTDALDEKQKKQAKLPLAEEKIITGAGETVYPQPMMRQGYAPAQPMPNQPPPPAPQVRYPQQYPVPAAGGQQAGYPQGYPQQNRVYPVAPPPVQQGQPLPQYQQRGQQPPQAWQPNQRPQQYVQRPYSQGYGQAPQPQAGIQPSYFTQANAVNPPQRSRRAERRG